MEFHLIANSTIIWFYNCFYKTASTLPQNSIGRPLICYYKFTNSINTLELNLIVNSTIMWVYNLFHNSFYTLPQNSIGRPLTSYYNFTTSINKLELDLIVNSTIIWVYNLFYELCLHFPRAQWVDPWFLITNSQIKFKTLEFVNFNKKSGVYQLSSGEV